MNTNDSKQKKVKKPKKRTVAAAIPRASGSRPTGDGSINDVSEPFCPLLAKDSEWVDIMQSSARTTPSESCNEEADSEDGPETKPIAIMFPGLLEKDPEALQGMLTKAMSTTEVTKHLVDLGEKANFTFMKKTGRLIPPDKQWLGSVPEVNSGSDSSTVPGASCSSNNEYREDTEEKRTDTKNHKQF